MKRSAIGLIALACLVLFGACAGNAQNTATGKIETAAPAQAQGTQAGGPPNGRATLAPTLLPSTPDPDDAAASPSAAPETPKSTPVVDTEKVALLATIVAAALQDGATPEIPAYMAGDPIPDDFLYAVIYFYQFCMDVPENPRILGDRAILPRISEEAYHLSESELVQIIQSFFGPMESLSLDVFAQSRDDAGDYAFSLSDGPIPKAEVLLAEWAEETLTVNVHLSYEPPESAEIGTLVLGLTPDEDSIFDLSIESFVFMPAAR